MKIEKTKQKQCVEIAIDFSVSLFETKKKMDNKR